MRFLTVLLLSSVLFSFRPLFAALHAPDPLSRFDEAVKADKSLSGGKEQWAGLSREFAADPLFAALGLDKASFAGGNHLTYDNKLALGGMEFDLKGDLYFDPQAAEDFPLASLRAKTRPASGDLLTIGALRARAATLDVVIYKEEAAYKVHARLIPNWTDHNKAPIPSLMISRSGETLDWVLTGGDIKLEEIVPAAAHVPYYKQFSFESLAKTGDMYAISGAVGGKKIAAKADAAGSTLEVTGKELLLSDFIPEVSAVRLLDGFAFTRFYLEGEDMTVSGTIGAKKASATRRTVDRSFTFSAEGLTLADVAPAAAAVPALARFSLESVEYTPKSLSASGRIGGKPASAVFSDSGRAVTVTADSLKLQDLLPEAAGLPFANDFSFRSLDQSPGGLVVHGSLNGVDAAVSRSTAAATLAITGDHLKLSDLVPAASGLKALDRFDFVSAVRTAAGLTVTGRLNGKDISVKAETSGRTTVTGEGLKAADFLPETGDVPLLSSLECDRVSWSADGTAISGRLRGRAIAVNRSARSGEISVTGDGLKVSDFVPEAAEVAFLDNFTLDRVRMTGADIDVYGKVDGKPVTVDDHPASNIFTVTGQDLKLSDFFPEAKNIGALDKFAFDRFTHTADSVESAGKVNGKSVSVARKTGSPELVVKGESLKLSDFVPQASGAPYLDRFAFLDLAWTPELTRVDGKVNGRNVSVNLDNAKKTYTVSGSAMKLTDFVPQAAQVPYLEEFDLQSVQSSPSGVIVMGHVSGRKTEVDYEKASGAFRITGDDIKLKDLVPEAAAVSYLDNFAFESFSWSEARCEAAGKVNGRKLSVSKERNAPYFSVNGDGLRLEDFVPAVSQVPCVNAFALDTVRRSPSELAIAGRVDGKPVAVSASSDGKVAMTGAGLSLPACMPLSLNIPFLKWFSFGGLFHWPDRLEIDGTVNGKAVKVVWIFAPDTVTLTGGSIKLADLVPAAAKVPELNNFAFLSMLYAPSGTTVSGTLNGKTVGVIVSKTDGSFEIKGDKLTLSDFVPEAASVPFLDNFAFYDFKEDASGITVEGAIHGRKVAVSKPAGASGSFTAAGEGLAMSDLVPEAGALKAFDALQLDKVSVSQAAVEVAGRLNGKAVKFVRTRGDKPVVTVTADALTLGDVFAPLAGLPAINAVGIEKIELDGRSVEAKAKLNGVTVDVVAHAKAGSDFAYTAIFFDRLGAAAFVPAAQGHVVNDIALEKALFVVQPAGSPARTVSAAELPGDLPKLAGWSGGDAMKLSEGVNMSAWLNVAASGGLARAFKTAGLPANARPLLRGTLPPGAFKGMSAGKAASALADADKQSMLAGLELEVDLPLPSLPAIAGLVTVKSPVTLRIGGDARSKSSLWTRVPEPIAASRPAGDLDVSVQFGLDIKGSGINEKIDALVNLDKGSRAGYSLLALYEGAWKEPFGIKGFTLDNGGFEFSLEGDKGAQKDAEFAFFATADIASKKVSVTADLKRTDGKLALEYFELDGKFGLGDFPGGKNIPNADKFELDMVKLSPKGVEAAAMIAGKKVKAYLFDAGAAGTPNWIFALEQKNFNITELIPPAKDIKPLAAMTLPQAALIVSEKGLTAPGRKGLGVIARDMLDGIFGDTDVPLNIPSGVALLAAFDQKAMGDLGKGLSKLGVHEDAIIMGAVTGVFQGNPGVMLSLAMQQPGQARGLPGKVMNYKDGVRPSFFIQWAGTEFDAGLKIPMFVKAGKDTLVLASSVELEFTVEGVGIKVLGEMDGVWRQPFGIKGFALANVKMDAAINDIGEVRFGVAGDQQYGHCGDPGSPDCVDVDLAMSVKILLEDALPDGVAFAGKVNKLSAPALVEITEHLMGLPPGKLGKLPFPFFQINDALLAFATPGASDPQLGLVSEGFAFGGDFFFMGRELGKVKGAGGPQGLTLKGKIDDIDLDVLQFRNNNVDIALGLDPKYVIDSDIELLGGKQHVKLDIEPPHMEFDLTEKLGVFGDAALTVTIEGFDLKTGAFDKAADISIIGAFKSTLVPWMKNEIKKGIDDLRASAGAKFDADLKALKSAEKKVDELTAKIQKLKEQDQKAKDRAEEVLNSAIRRVNSLRSQYDHEDHQAHHCGSKWTHWACAPGWRIAASATWTVMKVAEGALQAAKKAVAAAMELDPRIAALIAERDIERAALAVAEAVVEVTRAVEDFVMKELEKILEATVSRLPLEIDETVIVGDLRGMILRNEPMVLDMKFKLAGAPMREYFAVKVPDRPENLEFDAKAFALLPVLALDTLTEAPLKKISPDAAKWVHSHIATKLASAQEEVRKQVEEQEARYRKVLDSFENGSAKYRKAFEDQSEEHRQLVEEMDITDLMPDSLQYANTYLAIGHSNLCLAVSRDGVSVEQLHCKDSDVEQWHTVALKDDDEGYVELRNKGLCLKARKGDSADNYEPLILAACDAKDRHQQWKIISSDGFYDQIVNRFSQKCLHFDNESANPRSAYAVWTSCLGADSQTFRDIPDAEKPTRHEVNAFVKAENGLCLDVLEETENSLKLTAQNKEAKLYAHPCGDKSERFNYIEEVDGDIQLIHSETGACVYPAEKSTHLALRACDRGQDMFWRLNVEDKDTLQFFNPARNSCMMLPAPDKGTSNYKEAGTAPCSKTDGAQLLDLVK
ncbi:MAG TPA: ricin-type beta-trefoil lectin domain protein [Elusimicrobiales bacterium]|nr:ricin-type beta-trefoil lectin domain protein [Elusimicrobiales bacterium]